MMFYEKPLPDLSDPGAITRRRCCQQF